MRISHEEISNPRLHGNGFLQWDLPENQRLHVFDPELIPYGQKVKTMIHNHVFDMKSEILYGKLIHKTYNIKPKEHSEQGYRIYGAEYDMSYGSTKESTLKLQVFNYPDDYAFELSGEYHLPKGSSYFFKADEWHESITEGLTVTVITKLFTKKESTALVACPIGLEPDNEFRRDSVPKELVNSYIFRLIQMKIIS